MKGVTMVNTYTQIYIHIIFAVQGRLNLIRQQWKDELERYMTGIFQKRGHKLIVINAQPDHVHALIGLNPAEALSTLVGEVKTSSTALINDKGWVRGHFNWQEGYGAFSCGRSQFDKVCAYIRNQSEHHAKRSFREEFTQLLRRYNIAYEDAYIFEPVDEEAVREIAAGT